MAHITNWGLGPVDSALCTTCFMNSYVFLYAQGNKEHISRKTSQVSYPLPPSAERFSVVAKLVSRPTLRPCSPPSPNASDPHASPVPPRASPRSVLALSRSHPSRPCGGRRGRRRSRADGRPLAGDRPACVPSASRGRQSCSASWIDRRSRMDEVAGEEGAKKQKKGSKG